MQSYFPCRHPRDAKEGKAIISDMPHRALGNTAHNLPYAIEVQQQQTIFQLKKFLCKNTVTSL